MKMFRDSSPPRDATLPKHSQQTTEQELPATSIAMGG